MEEKKKMMEEKGFWRVIFSHALSKFAFPCLLSGYFYLPTCPSTHTLLAFDGEERNVLCIGIPGNWLGSAFVE